MAAPKKKLFKTTTSQNPVKKEESIQELKSQLSNLQSKIEGLEGVESPKEVSKKVQESYHKVVNLFEWESASHVFIPRGKKWLTFIILFTAIIALIILFLREFFILGPLLAIAFFAYVLSSIPPENIEHRITTQGLITGKKEYLWEELYDFWFTKKHGHQILNVDLQSGYPGRVMLIIKEKDKEKVRDILLEILPYREIPRTNWMDSVSDYLSNLFHKIAS